MSYQVFARKYRPKTFADVLGQDHVVRTLSNAIAQNRLAHAYLFVGPRGTGKTSTARILAKALNCTGGPKIDFDPDEDICQEIAEGRSLDVLEIDGASNNGVEQVRDLRESVRFSPARGQFKIYYIDEVHMLSNAAFNALLKTLEEPPPHVKFIFATTEANKILPTIISRCQRFDLRPIPTETIAAHLQHIAAEEGITLEATAAWAIAKGADGGMRDAQSMLDQLVAFCGETITEANVLDIFGFTSREKVAQLTGCLLSRETPAALSLIQKEAETGRELSQLLGELIGCLRALLVAKLDPTADGEGIPADLWNALLEAADEYPPDRILAAIDVFAETEGRMKWATNKRLHFELGVIKSIQTLGEVRITDVIKVLTRGADFIPVPEPRPVQTEQTPPSAPASTAAPEEPAPVEATTSETPTDAPPATPEPEPEPESAAPAPPATIVVESEPKRSKPIGGAIGALDSLIAAAPEESEPPAAPEPAPWEEPKKAAEPEPAPAAAPIDDAFHQDPLIQSALEKFEGKILR
ncbi:DNA polymerase III subunit gamma/tau [Luteolibacter pohnpeiensis]|uniref:DNA polymerase III subunit gamma/tau n=1 Tax=Luteolibacter pohnpeiensis TaxID=454153 RepID=A0A934S5D1_9BACT|nr:DNA polymerase III subunit gamma/tau [Luteolibacter pohnpeiensis]MBK1882163.1 DNA polymerase III subunit gamma/tau [Luteolibacter pohnpeiensis]